jgi:hypothetical protein
MGDFHTGSRFLRAAGGGTAAPPLSVSTISGFFYFLKKSNSFHTSDKRVRKRDQMAPRPEFRTKSISQIPHKKHKKQKKTKNPTEKNRKKLLQRSKKIPVSPADPR